MTPWHDCAPCHFLPDGSPSATDPPCGQLNVPANSVREGHCLPTACRIPPAMAIAGRHHRVCVATSRRPHPHLLGSGCARTPSLAHQPLCQRQRPSLRWIRAKEARTPGSRRGDSKFDHSWALAMAELARRRVAMLAPECARAAR